MKTMSPTLPERHKNVECCRLTETSMLGRVQAESVASQFKALSDPTRLQILDLLIRQSEPLCVCDLLPLFAQHQPTINHHLRILLAAGFVATEKQGIWTHYWATPRAQRALDASMAALGSWEQ